MQQATTLTPEAAPSIAERANNQCAWSILVVAVWQWQWAVRSTAGTLQSLLVLFLFGLARLGLVWGDIKINDGRVAFWPLAFAFFGIPEVWLWMRGSRIRGTRWPFWVAIVLVVLQLVYPSVAAIGSQSSQDIYSNIDQLSRVEREKADPAVSKNDQEQWKARRQQQIEALESTIENQKTSLVSKSRELRQDVPHEALFVESYQRMVSQSDTYSPEKGNFQINGVLYLRQEGIRCSVPSLYSRGYIFGATAWDVASLDVFLRCLESNRK